MNLQDRAKEYLEYCTYRKELDAKEGQVDTIWNY